MTISVTRLAVPWFQPFTRFGLTSAVTIYTGERAPVPTADKVSSARLYYILMVNIHHQGPHAFFKASKTPLSVASCTSTTFSLDFEPEPIDTSLFFTPSTELMKSTRAALASPSLAGASICTPTASSPISVMVAILEPGLAWTEMATVDGAIRRRQPGNSPPAAAALAAAAAAPAAAASRDGYGRARRLRMRDKVVEMFYHAYDNYMEYAFPHDELKPLTKGFTDSLSELGNLNLEHLPQDYNGSALTLVESLSSLVVLGNLTEFDRGVSWLSENLTFDVDARVNLFECNIRLLGGLISAHILAKDYSSQNKDGVYQNQLLHLAENLGSRFLPAFETPTGLPYAWINLKYGVMENETTETSTSGCGSLILEMGALSRLTGDPRYEAAALRALRKLWSMRSSLNLVGSTLDVLSGNWIEYSSGIGAGVDSFYEYLIKAYILFGSDEYWDMFHSAYLAVQKYFRHGPWYHEADIRTGEATHWQLTSLQAFWPGVQTLLGDVAAANLSHREFYNVWQRFGVLPERYLLDYGILHPTEKYYPLRPEFAESTFYLYQATKDPWYLEVGEAIIGSLNYYTKVEGGFASIRDVSTMNLEDHQHSFFLSETCKYLFLLYDDSFLRNKNYIFTTEGHPLPVMSTWHEKIPRLDVPTNWTVVKDDNQPIRVSALSSKVCPETIFRQNVGSSWESACHVPDVLPSHRCRADDDCGIESVTCKRRTCSMAGYCGLWLAVY